MEKEKSLFDIIKKKMANDEATQEISDILSHCHDYFTPELKGELDAPAPV